MRKQSFVKSLELAVQVQALRLLGLRGLLARIAALIATLGGAGWRSGGAQRGRARDEHNECMSSPHHLRALAGCNNRTPALRAVALMQRSQSSASLRGSGSAEAMVSAVEGLPEDVMPVQQIEQAVYARVIAHKPRAKSRQNPSRCSARPKEVPLDPYTISEHHGGGLSGGIYLARRFGRALQWPLSSVVHANSLPIGYACHATNAQ